MKIVIYGAGVYGTLTKKILERNGMVVLAFIDRKLSGTKVEEIPVVGPEKIEDYKKCKIYIATKNYYGEIKRYLLKSGCENISDIVDILETDIVGIQLTENEKDAWMQRNTYRIAVEMDAIEGNTLVHLEAVVTEMCSLRCRDCSSLMPHYGTPHDVEIADLIGWINQLLRVVSYIGELRILGGEPFLNKQIDKLICQFADNEKIGMITIYTNGTVVPDEAMFRCISRHKVFVHISDYGIGEKNRTLFVEKCKKYQIAYVVRTYDEWYEFGPFVLHDVSEKELVGIYQNCISANCYTVRNGRLYHCPRAAHASALGLIEDKETDYLNLQKEIENPKKINDFIYGKKYIDACRYCYGTGNSNKRVRAGVQLENSL